MCRYCSVSPGRQVPHAAHHEYIVALHCLHTFSVKGSPTGGYCSILLALPSLQVGSPRCSPVGTQSSTLRIHLVNLWVEGPLVCMLWRPHVSARSSPVTVAGDTLRHPADGAKNLDGVPTSCHVQGRCKQWRSPVPLGLDCSLSSQRAFMVSQPSLCGLSLLFVQKSFS